MPFKAPYPQIDLPVTDIFSLLFKRKDRTIPDDHTIFRDATSNRSYSFADVEQKALDFGKGLKALYEWKKGDVLALFTSNSIDIPPITFGTLWAGGILSPANPAYTVSELSHQLHDCKARMIATQIEYLDKVKAACSEAGLFHDQIILLGESRDRSGRIKHWTSVRNISGATRFRPTKINPKTDVAFLVYSSGTTGKPKGVRLSHYNLTSNVIQVQWSEQFNLTWDGSKTFGDIPLPGPGGDKILACLPFFHIYGLTMFVLSPVYSGVTTFVMEKFEIKNWCSLVPKHRITYSYIVPPIAIHLSKHPIVSSFDLSSIRMINCGAAPLGKHVVEAVFKRTGIRIKQGYGLSETSPGLFHQRWEEWLSGAGSVGWLLPNMEAKFCQPMEESALEREPTQELKVGEVGELHVRGPNVFLGYHNNDSATAECLSPDGWFRTGDIGYIDKNNNLHITDRAKELIKYKGFQVAPAELEALLIQIPEVADCAVIGINSQALETEVPRAYIVMAGKAAISMTEKDGESIAQWLAQRVAPYKKLRGGVKFVDSIPKTASGKILRKVLKQSALEEDETKVEIIKARL
ncbi:acetyl-CoA synthetase-like protein [Tothia fuscella]|uniref:Acetyl-CoA synthetase-like protein n=1 Tax=Tothia fuscella TaxID=1048955 RepID=A0A9P4NQI1_9PEZI|nr:acetyl-CoA synthetase-like protein [Tothia fuscella]